MNVLFYSYPDTAYGTVYSDLTKVLYQYGVNCQLLPWNLIYSGVELLSTLKCTDVLVTCPSGASSLSDVIEESGVKTVISLQSNADVFLLEGLSILPKAVTKASDHLRYDCTVLPVRIISDRFKKISPVTDLRSVGIGGVYRRSDSPHTDLDIKRGYLASRVAGELGLEFKSPNCTFFPTMVGFYSTVDCILVPSIEEGVGLPALEASAAGRMVLSTGVGVFPLLSEGNGYVVPVQEDLFVAECCEILGRYLVEQEQFVQDCNDIREHSKEYDWGYASRNGESACSKWADLLYDVHYT